jgi:hypothetical protein
MYPSWPSSIFLGLHDQSSISVHTAWCVVAEVDHANHNATMMSLSKLTRIKPWALSRGWQLLVAKIFVPFDPNSYRAKL